jgi:hypothetical protein
MPKYIDEYIVSEIREDDLKSTLCWDVTPCSLVKIDRRFININALMETISVTKTSVSIYMATRRNFTEDSHLYTRRRENLKFHRSLHAVP